jgi:uncharacterized protein YggE
MNHLKNTLLGIISLIMLALPTAAFASPILAVEGAGTSQAKPDQATVVVGVSTADKNAQQAQHKNAAQSSAVQSAIINLGIPENCVRTENYNFAPSYDNKNGSSNNITGYNVENNVCITINDISLTGKVIDTALSHGANQVSSLDFNVRDITAARNQALQAAIRDARSKADAIAASLDRQIIGIKTISENTSYAPLRSNRLMLSKAVDMTSATPVQAGLMDFSANVHIEFILSD